MQKTEYDQMKIASMENEATGKSGEHAKWQRYYSHLKILLKTDLMLKILRPNLIGPLDKPISVPPHGTNKLDAINLILRMLDDMSFYANAFDGDDLLSCSLEQLEDARSKFVEIMICMVGKATILKTRSLYTRTYSVSASQDRPTMPQLTLRSSQTDPSAFAGCP